MPTIGDVIISTRGKIPDIQGIGLVSAPTVPTAAGAVNFNGVLTPSTAYFLVMTLVFPWGETLPSPEFTGSTSGGQNSLNLTAIKGSPGMVGVKIYSGLATGQEQSAEFIPVSFGTTTAVFDGNNLVPLTPPTRSTAYMADSDGNMFGAGTLYKWLNDGLNKLSHAVGGILDYCGVTTTPGNGMYVIPGQWLKITDVWYGGYWIKGGNRAEYFRRNTVTSNVLQMVTISVTGGQQVMEVSYQPDRASGVTATTGNVTATANSVQIANTSVFLLPFGFAQIGNEIVAYSKLQGTTMSGLVRGLGNTVAQARPTGTVVNELSLFWNGRRVFNDAYYPGQSGTLLPIPIGWVTILEDYMLAQAKKAEQNLQEWKQLEENAFAQAQAWLLANKGVTSRVQVGGNNEPYVYDQTVAGGILIP